MEQLNAPGPEKLASSQTEIPSQGVDTGSIPGTGVKSRAPGAFGFAHPSDNQDFRGYGCMPCRRILPRDWHLDNNGRLVWG